MPFTTMDFQFDQFDTACFRGDPRRTVIGQWTVEHRSFAAPPTVDRPPLVFIGGAFQNAWSFYREVKHFLPQRPIVLVDLPGQGQNDQLSAELGFADLADLLRQFLDQQLLDRVIPVGLSYGSGIAFTLAQRFPDRIERLLLGGITDQIRERVDRALRSTFWYLDHGRHDEFADAAVHHLLNLHQRDVTRVSDRLIERLRLGMMELTDLERIRYRHNTARLFRDRLDGSLSCRTLVFTSKYDHFTAPFEALAVANRCQSGEFVMIERGDHLVPIEDPKTVLALYDAFVNDTPLADVRGVMVGANAAAACTERRMLERRPGRRRDVKVTGQSGREWRAHLLNYSAHGCLLEMPQCPQLADESEPFRVSIPSIGAEGDAVLLPAAEGARAVFLRDAFGSLGKLPVSTVEMPTPAAAPARERRVSLAERLAALTDE
jgi:pimeloyl-ACP methyl ester carboxylesterase